MTYFSGSTFLVRFEKHPKVVSGALQREIEVLFSNPKKSPFSISSSPEHKTTTKRPGSYSLPYSTHMSRVLVLCGYAHIYVVMMAQFVLNIEKLSHIIGARGSQDLRSPSPIMAPDINDHYIPIRTLQFTLCPRCQTFNALVRPRGDYRCQDMVSGFYKPSQD